MADMVDISANTYEHREFVVMEMDVARALDFHLSGITVAPFLVHFLRAAGANAKQAALAWYLAELGLLDYGLVGLPPSVVAAAIVHLTRQTLLPASAPLADGTPGAVWTPQLRHYTRYRGSELAEAGVLLWRAHRRAWEGTYAAVRTKHARADRFHVSEFVTCLPEEALRFRDE